MILSDCSNESDSEHTEKPASQNNQIPLFNVDENSHPKYFYPCSAENKETCIRSELLCDNKYNCGDGENFRSDEKHCSNILHPTNNVTNEGIMRIEGHVANLPPYYISSLIPAAHSVLAGNESALVLPNSSESGNITLVQELDGSIGLRIFHGLNVFMIVASIIVVILLAAIGMKICCVNCIEDVKSLDRRPNTEAIQDWERPIIEVQPGSSFSTPVIGTGGVRNVVEDDNVAIDLQIRKKHKLMDNSVSPPPPYSDLFPTAPNSDFEVDLDGTERGNEKIG